jgi:hypothetical protein
VNNQVTLSYTYAPRVDADGISYNIKEGMVGLGANNSKAKIDNVIVQRLAPVTTFSKTVDFSSGTTGLFQAPLTGTWSLVNGRYAGTGTATLPAIDLTAINVTSASLIDLSGTFKTTGEGGSVFDEYAADDFKFVTISAGKITLGHRTPRGWFTDAVYNNASLVAGSDFTLGVNLRGSMVSVLLNNQMVLSKTYNALVTDGNTGLFSRSGVTSFDTVTYKSDDPALTTVQFLRAESAGQATVNTPQLSSDALAPVVTAAVQNWKNSLDSTQQAALDSVTVLAADLPDGVLGQAMGATILIDLDAAGNGWFIDPTPHESSEFRNGVATSVTGVDLLTVITHEFGHVLGFNDLDTTRTGELMAATLATGTRYAELSPDAAAASVQPMDATRFLSFDYHNGLMNGFGLVDTSDAIDELLKKAKSAKESTHITGEEGSLVSLDGPAYAGQNNSIGSSHTESGKAWLSDFLGSTTRNENRGIRITI